MGLRRVSRHVSVLLVLVLLTLALPLLPAASVAAAITVTNTRTNTSFGSIQAAIDDAGTQDGDTLSVSAGLDTENVTVTKGVTIQGAGASVTTVDGGNNGAVFLITTAPPVTISGMTIQHGSGTPCNIAGATCGGGIYRFGGGTLTVTNAIIANNSQATNGGAGGGIFYANFGGTLTVTNSTFSGNSGPGGGGAIFDTGTLTVTNSTFSGNSASQNDGGAIRSNGSAVTVTNSTFSGNSAIGGGGILANGGTVTLTNTIVANSPSGGNCNSQNGGIITAGSDTLADDGTCGSASPVTSAQINLQPLVDNGGPIPTMALGTGSLAINTGTQTGCPATDERGAIRDSQCDIGAYEFGARFPITTALTGSPNPSIFGQPVTLTATVASAVSNVGTPSGTVTFMDGTTTLGTGTLSGGVATLVTSSLAVGGPNLTAVYNGDATFASGTSPPTLQTVNPAATTTTLTSAPNPSAFGQSVTLTATVSAVPPGAGTPTGIVSFFDSATFLGTGTLSGGVATFATTSLAVSSHSLTAIYGRDSNFIGSASHVSTQQVTAPIIVLAPASLPDGNVGVTYSQTLTASGGVGPYIFTATGSLPPGVTLASDGTLSGTPTTNGAFTFTVTATDANGFTGQQAYTVTIGTAVVQSVTLDCGSTADVPVGGSVICVATGHFSDGSTQSLTTGVTYTTSDANVATIDPTTGAITGKGVGTATITASYPGVPAVQITLTVHPPTVTGVQPPTAPQGRSASPASGSPPPPPAPNGRTGMSGNGNPPPAPTGR